MNRFIGRSSPISSPTNFRELFERNRLPVFRYIYGLTGGPQEVVEDLVAETFLHAWKARGRFVGELETATGWLIRIAKRLVIDDHRRNMSDFRKATESQSNDLDPEQAAMEDERQGFLLSLLARLPEDQREMITLRHLLGWKVGEIARHMGMTENNISVTIHRGLAKIREIWAQAERGTESATPKNEE